MAPKAKAPPADSRTVEMDGLAIRISRSCLRGLANVSILQSGRVVAVGRANREQLAELTDVAVARRGAMASKETAR